jgi:hypothetical protein
MQSAPSHSKLVVGFDTSGPKSSVLERNPNSFLGLLPGADVEPDPILVHLTASTVMVEYGNMDPPAGSTRAKLVIRPLGEDEAIRWARLAFGIALSMTVLVCVGLALTLFEFRLDRSLRCVLRPDDQRTAILFGISNAILAVSVVVYTIFLVRFGLILKRQRGWRSFLYYAMWFHTWIKLIFASYAALIVMALVPPSSSATGPSCLRSRPSSLASSSTSPWSSTT